MEINIPTINSIYLNQTCIINPRSEEIPEGLFGNLINKYASRDIVRAPIFIVRNCTCGTNSYHCNLDSKEIHLPRDRVNSSVKIGFEFVGASRVEDSDINKYASNLPANERLYLFLWRLSLLVSRISVISAHELMHLYYPNVVVYSGSEQRGLKRWANKIGKDVNTPKNLIEDFIINLLIPKMLGDFKVHVQKVVGIKDGKKTEIKLDKKDFETFKKDYLPTMLLLETLHTPLILIYIRDSQSNQGLRLECSPLPLDLIKIDFNNESNFSYNSLYACMYSSFEELHGYQGIFNKLVNFSWGKFVDDIIKQNPKEKETINAIKEEFKELGTKVLGASPGTKFCFNFRKTFS